MADFCSVVQAINDLVVRIERLEDSCEIGSIVLRLDYINRMLVNLDVPDDIVNEMSGLYETVVAIEANHSTQARHGYQGRLRHTGARGRPSFQIPQEQLSFLLDQGFKVSEIGVLLGVGQRTVERRMSAFGLSVSGFTCGPMRYVVYTQKKKKNKSITVFTGTIAKSRSYLDSRHEACRFDSFHLISQLLDAGRLSLHSVDPVRCSSRIGFDQCSGNN